ncbi:hypothetical protein LCGC14_0708420 [marine sediment metagenome]|uniref:Crp/Fnr family transcriptional regulator n=2 Tax=root TaxID=1 RepID=A0A831QMI9_9FLAO|nr:Crp/Fnr family transcriptional regulator [Pricia antarctica]
MNDFQIFKNIQNHIVLNEVEKLQIIASFSVIDIQKKQQILEQGKLCKRIYFVESGSLRAFNIGVDGKTSTIMFAVKDWWITDMNAFVKKCPSLFYIEALETSKVVALEFDALERLCETVPKLERFFRILFQNAYIREQQRALQSISMTTDQRYRQFIMNYPAIVQKVTQKQIASYLGITPEFLSAIKNK